MSYHNHRKSIPVIAVFLCLLIGGFSKVYGQDITTVAGSGVGPLSGDGGPAIAAHIGLPSYTTIDGLGNVYVAGNYKVRKIDANTGIITTVAGTGVAGLTAAAGMLATAAQFTNITIAADDIGNLFINEQSTYRIWKVHYATGVLSLVAGTGVRGNTGDGGPATAATISGGVMRCNNDDELFLVSDHKIRKINLSGIISTVAGTGLPGSNGDGGPATAARISPNGYNITTDTTGSIYFIDTCNVVRKIDAATGTITRKAGLTNCGSATYSGDGAPATNAAITAGCIAADNYGNIFIAGNGRVLMVDPAGIISTICGDGTSGYSGDGGPATAARISSDPHGLEADDCGNIFLADYANARIRKVTLHTSCTCSRKVAVEALPDGAVCAGTTVTYTAAILGGGTATTHQWYVNGVLVATGGASYSYAPNDGDSVWCTASASGGSCIPTTTATSRKKHMSVYATPAISGTLSTCLGSQTVLSHSVPGGTWASSSVSVAPVSGGTVTGASVGTAVISYSIGTNCVITTVFTVHALPSAGVLSGPDSLCEGASAVYTSTVAGGSWRVTPSGFAAISSVGKMLGQNAGVVIISYAVPADANGCQDTSTYQVEIVKRGFVVDTEVIAVTCYDGHDGRATVVATPPGAYQYQWSSGDTASTAMGLSAGSYSVQVVEVGTGCVARTSIEVTQPDSMQLDAAIHSSLCWDPIGSIAMHATGGVPPYQWQWLGLGISGPNLAGLAEGTYTVLATDSKNCTKEVWYNVGSPSCFVFVPNAISPNGDGLNDTWIMVDLNIYASNEVQVFDKWGDVVFEETNYQNKWDGRGRNGAPLPDGTYYYLVKLTGTGKQGDEVLRGNLMIKR